MAGGYRDPGLRDVRVSSCEVFLPYAVRGCRRWDPKAETASAWARPHPHADWLDFYYFRSGWRT